MKPILKQSKGGKKKVIKAWMAVNPTKYDNRYKDNWFDQQDFRIDHKSSLFIDKKSAKQFIENRIDWIVVECEIHYKLTPSSKKVVKLSTKDKNNK